TKGARCQRAAHALVLDDATIRGRKSFAHCKIEGIASFDVGGSAHAAVPEEVSGKSLPHPACAYFVARAFMA
ncbi:MAG: hypothetical protein ACRECZ_01765, partial [Methylocella sp.]